MAHHDFTTPVTEEQVRALRVNDPKTLAQIATQFPGMSRIRVLR
jgi:hypothetical protein